MRPSLGREGRDPEELGQCPNFHRIYFLKASLCKQVVQAKKLWLLPQKVQLTSSHTSCMESCEVLQCAWQEYCFCWMFLHTFHSGWSLSAQPEYYYCLLSNRETYVKITRSCNMLVWSSRLDLLLKMRSQKSHLKRWGVMKCLVKVPHDLYSSWQNLQM